LQAICNIVNYNVRFSRQIGFIQRIDYDRGIWLKSLVQLNYPRDQDRHLFYQIKGSLYQLRNTTKCKTLSNFEGQMKSLCGPIWLVGSKLCMLYNLLFELRITDLNSQFLHILSFPIEKNYNSAWCIYFEP